jgi:pimeloyl-ACP methyl ester carboxylesterase
MGDYYGALHSGRSPIVVMAHGFAAERTFKLPAYAERFARAGLGVFLFDYRGFGDSEGQPRHVVSFRRQREDYRAAIEFARSLEGVDPDRVVLWGTSYSGGHVIAVAALETRIAAVVAQIPAVDLWASAARYGWTYAAKAALHACLDIGKSMFRLSPHYVHVFGPPGPFAVMNQPDCAEGYSKIIPGNSRWQNRCAARELLLSLGNRPIRQAARVRCPVMVIMAQQDQLLPARTIATLAGLLPDGKLVKAPGDHFSVYFGAEFERLVALQTEFIRGVCCKSDAQVETAEEMVHR